MKTRIISATVGIALLIVVFLLSNTPVLPLVIGLIIAMILFELSRAVGGEKFHLALVGVLIYGFASPFIEFLLCRPLSPEASAWMYYMLTIIRQLVLSLCLICVFLEFLWHHGKFKVEQLAFMSASMYFVSWSLSRLVVLKFSHGEHGLFYLILALCGAWIADSGAYFSGVALGKHKLCPNISPKKTVEGFVGGMLSNAVIFALIFWIYAVVWNLPFDILDGLKAALLGLVCAGISVIGDLTASVIKREKGIKDYGHIMPGHGGMMDRFDSVLFVVPAFDIVMTMFPIF